MRHISGQFTKSGGQELGLLMNWSWIED